ncbi:MAG: hypothetical protein H6640_00940 [Caldilineaceae bacterium]|nr:hypothetical protein [Caldilineaceae bacterium]
MQKVITTSAPARNGVGRSLAVGVAAVGLVTVLVALLAWPAAVAKAQIGGNGTVVQDTASQFSAACAVLPGVAAAPALSGTIISPVNNGEIRLRATVEDYFDGTEIDATQWITGYSNPSYPNEAPEIGGGLLTLYGSYLRSQTVFTESLSPRFFDARVQFVGGGLPSPTNGDIGFYRVLPPLRIPPGDQSSIRLFVSQPFNSTNNRLMYVRSRDGTSVPLIDTLVDNWTDDEPTQRIGLSVFRNYRIDWGATDTWYSIDGSTIITAGVGDNPLPHTGVATRTTYAFLYNQDPEVNSPDPLLIDWVRAGQYPATGSYTSCAQDAGQVANWSQVTVSSTLPAGTSGVVETRTSVDGATWSAWTSAGALANGSATLPAGSPSGRYFQYRVLLATTDPLQSPEVQRVASAYFGPDTIAVAPSPATLDPAASQQFAAEVRDSNTSLITGASLRWSVQNGGGVIDATGRFTAGLPAGTFANTVLVTATTAVSNVASVIVRDLAPVANAGGPYTGNEGQAVSLSAAASSDPNGGLLSYAWDLDNDGEFDDALGVSTSYAWPDNGAFQVGVIVTDTAGLTGTATASVVISNLDPVISSVVNNGPVRRSQTVTVTVNASDVPADTLLYSFDWDNNGSYEVVNQTSNVAATSFAATGSYVVGVRVVDGDGGVATGTTTVVVQPQTLGVTALSNSGPVRRAQAVTVIVTGTQELADTLGYSFDWNNDTIFETGPQASNASTMAFAVSGNFTVTARITDTDGGAAISSTVVTVLPQALQVSAVTNSGPAARGAPVTVIVTATQELSDTLSYSFDWDDNGIYDVVDQAGNSATTSYLSTGVKSVRVRVRDAGNGEASATTSVTIVPQTVQIAAVTDTSPVRRGSPVQVAVTATQQLSDALLYSFDWNNDGTYDVVDQPGNTASTVYASTGQKAAGVRVRDTDGGAATATITMTVLPQALQVASVTNSGPVVREKPVTVTVEAIQQLTDVLAYSFDWNNDGTYEVVDQPSPSAVTAYPTTGAKVVGVRVRDADGAQATGVTTVTVAAQELQIVGLTNSGPVIRGRPVTVVVTATQQLNDVLSYSFDWNADGVYDVVDSPAASATTSFDTPGSKSVRVRVRDTQGSATVGETVVQVNAQSLSISAVENSGPVDAGQIVTVTVTATQELSDQLTYSFDWEGDGTFDVVEQTGPVASTRYAGEGLFQAVVRVRDSQGSEARATTLIEVLGVGGTGDAGTIYLPAVMK